MKRHPELGFSPLFILDLESRVKIFNSAHTHTNHTYNRIGDAILGFCPLFTYGKCPNHKTNTKSGFYGQEAINPDLISILNMHFVRRWVLSIQFLMCIPCLLSDFISSEPSFATMCVIIQALLNSNILDSLGKR